MSNVNEHKSLDEAMTWSDWRQHEKRHKYHTQNRTIGRSQTLGCIRFLHRPETLYRFWWLMYFNDNVVKRRKAQQNAKRTPISRHILFLSIPKTNVT